jgi:hypothetical protein
MAPVKRLVIDVLKPHDPPLVAFTERLARAETVDGVTTTLIERDTEVENITVTLEGADLEIDAVEAAVEELGAALHSVDQVSCGEHVVADAPATE